MSKPLPSRVNASTSEPTSSTAARASVDSFAETQFGASEAVGLASSTGGAVALDAATDETMVARVSPAPLSGGDASPTDEIALPSGTVIEGRYRVERPLGEGGMSTVYEATDLVTQRVIVLKTLRQAFARPELARLLRSEFQTMAALHHPNLAEVYDFIVTGEGAHLFTMERVNGQDLMTATEGASWQTVVGLVVQVCRALAYVHSRGLVHFDIKPANVLVDATGTVKVLDFGVAAVKNELQPGVMRGTPIFMAPELFEGRVQEIDQRVDLYALGMTLFALLCRRSPVEAGSLTTIMQAVAAGHAAQFTEAEQALVPAWLRGVVESLSAREASDRFPTAGAVVAAINAHVDPPFDFETEATRASYLLSSRFVGRAKQLARLNRFVERRVAGVEPACMLVVSGEGGAGKSRLMREVRHRAQIGRLTFVVGDCHEASSAELAPVAQVVALLERVCGAIGAGALIERYGPELVKVEPTFGQGRVQATEVLADSSAERFRIQQAAVEFTLALARLAPIALYFNDLQWAPAATARFVEALALTLAEHAVRGAWIPLALLGSARPEDSVGRPIEAVLTGLTAAGLLDRVELPPRGGAPLHDMMRSMLGIEALPKAFVARIVAEAGDNPFFVEEVMRALVESGAISQQVGTWTTVDAIDALEIPTSMVELVARRLSSLDADHGLCCGCSR